jgi:hypothetical protein
MINWYIKTGQLLHRITRKRPLVVGVFQNQDIQYINDIIEFIYNLCISTIHIKNKKHSNSFYPFSHSAKRLHIAEYRLMKKGKSPDTTLTKYYKEFTEKIDLSNFCLVMSTDTDNEILVIHTCKYLRINNV